MEEEKILEKILKEKFKKDLIENKRRKEFCFSVVIKNSFDIYLKTNTNIFLIFLEEKYGVTDLKKCPAFMNAFYSFLKKIKKDQGTKKLKSIQLEPKKELEPKKKSFRTDEKNPQWDDRFKDLII